jgi:leucyl aminopeptidase
LTENYLEQPGRLSLSVEPTSQGFGGFRAIFKTAPEKPAAGDPGKQAGDILLEKTSDGKQVIVVSLGSQSKRNTETFRQAGGGLSRWLKQVSLTSIEIDLDTLDTLGVPGALAALCEGLCLGSFQFNRYKSKQETLVNIKITLLTDKDQTEIALIVKDITILTDAVNMARDWAHEPPNVINPISLAERAADVAQQFGLKCTIIDDKALAEMNAGGILNVGKGSSTPSRLIILEYSGNNVSTSTQPVVLIGKAITFDTGGYSLKGTDNIQGMKYDKCGGLAVIGALRAAAELQIKTPVIGIIGAAENKISSGSYLPDDIITTLSGLTVEIISTDAEGRMVLADCLTYAQRKFHPRAMIDLATLTGAVVVALGHVRAGLMTNNDGLSQELMEAGDRTYERLWRLPLDEEFVKNIKGDDSDLKNSGGREAGTIAGGTFLRQFVSDEVPWAHLDIAGVADTSKDLPYCPKGGTGFGVRLLVDYLQHIDSQL